VGPKKKYPRRVGPGYLVPGQVFHSLSRQPVNRDGRPPVGRGRQILKFFGGKK
jgi:hypothetical protein